MNYKSNIGKRVCKGSILRKEPNNKPFKSGLKINTVKGIINHPHLNVPAYVFEEDDSYVECRRCIVIDERSVYQDKILNFLKNKKHLLLLPNKELVKQNKMEELELHLDYCDECMQMTNHLGDECQKCKAKELRKYDIDIDDDEENYKIKKYLK